MHHCATSRAIVGLFCLLLALVACAPVQPLTVTTSTTSAVTMMDRASTTITESEAVTTTAVGSGQPGPVHCLIDFEATVRQGPSNGVALLGVFDFKVDEEGVLYGKLMQENGGEIMAAGQVIGRAVHLVFDLGEDQTVFGVGTAKARITNDICGLELGGPFVGPQPGDAGDWLAKRLGGNPASTITCDVSCD